jgi:HEPN domain-containing protein
MTKDELKTLIEQAETQLILAKDSLNAGDYAKAAVRIEKVVEKTNEAALQAKVLDGRKRSNAADAELADERLKS